MLAGVLECEVKAVADVLPDRCLNTDTAGLGKAFEARHRQGIKHPVKKAAAGHGGYSQADRVFFHRG